MAQQGSSSVLALAGVTFRRAGREILHGIDLDVRAGEHWALLGPNGAGKSTVLGFCAAEQFPTSGTVEVLGRRLGRVELAELRRHIGHVTPRHPLESPLTAHEVVLTGLTGTLELPMRFRASAEQVALADRWLEEVGLAERRTARWTTMSQGERGRALIARALVSGPRLLLLDEPTTGLDLAAREQLLATIAALPGADPSLASVLVTHHLEELPASTSHAFLIADGAEVVSGPVADVLTSEWVSKAFGHPIEVTRDRGRWGARSL